VGRPVLLVRGRRNPILPWRIDGRRAGRALSRAGVVTFRCGHQPFVEVPRPFVEAVLPFLDATTGGDR
jgi:pimeloyl-ACP methyl ester carboxylesterase